MTSKLALAFASFCALQLGCSGFAPSAVAQSNPYDPHQGTTMDWSGTEPEFHANATFAPETEQPREIPEPGTVGALLLTGLGIVSCHKKRQLTQG